MQNTIYSREEAAKRAENSTGNVPGTCQLWTRTMIGAESAGDVNHDGDSDAVDGWQSEPVKYRHKDRKPPRGCPVAFHGGSNGFGHRAISLGDTRKWFRKVTHLRSTDFDGKTKRYSPGTVGTGTIDEILAAFGTFEYTGWSETMDGQMIKNDNPHAGRGPRIEHALDDLGHAKGTGRRRSLINRAKELLRKIKHLGR